ncbi:hypothetical protein OG21DRAFT_902782 [Imleria badia]|nr:hypothetical protein OG21DRAFT_902782 [Imleria badia]
MAQGRDWDDILPIQVPAGPSLDEQLMDNVPPAPVPPDVRPPPQSIPLVYQHTPKLSRSRITSTNSTPSIPGSTDLLHREPLLQPRPRARSPPRRQARPEPPLSQGMAPVIPEPIRERTWPARLDHDMGPSQRGHTPERRPSTPLLAPPVGTPDANPREPS